MRMISRFLQLLSLTVISLVAQAAEVPLSPEGQAAYKAHLAKATKLVEQEKVEEAVAEVKAARTLNPKGYEAPATLALILQAAGKPQEAAAAIAEALKLAPPEALARVEAIAKMIGPEMATQPAATATPAADKQPANALTGTARRKYDSLLLIVAEADQAKSPVERQKLLREFMAKSADFIVEHEDATNVWVLRAAASLELDYSGSGWFAGKWLKEVGAEDNDASNIRKLMAQLERKGWLGKERMWREWSRFSTVQVRQMADDGDQEAQRALGDWYSHGQAGLTKDDEAAVIWFRKAAEQGDADAQAVLATKYRHGTGVSKDEAQATHWYRKSAELGHAVAQFLLALSYHEGWGVIKNEAEDMRWCRRSAEQGYSLAQVTLGHKYNGGQGVTKDAAEAARWFRKAAEQGNVSGQNSLAWLLATSSNADIRDGKEAVSWATKACEATEWRDWSYMDTLAAAHAEAGDFGQAVTYEQRVIRLIDSSEAKKIKEAEERLKLYEADRPFRENE